MEAFELLKLLTVFATPLGLALLLGLAGLLLKRRWLLLVALVWLWAWSTPWLATRSARALEAHYYPLRTAAELPQADVILLLGGGLSPRIPGWNPAVNLNSGADRLLLALELLRANKAPKILYSGGVADPQLGSASEARDGAVLLRDWGAPADALILEEQSRTTRENARYSLPLLQTMAAKRVLLVTSIWHMPRALATFRAEAAHSGAYIEFIPAPCDPLVVNSVPLQAMLWLPDTEALDASRRVFKEWLGLAWFAAGGH